MKELFEEYGIGVILALTGVGLIEVLQKFLEVVSGGIR